MSASLCHKAALLNGDVALRGQEARGRAHVLPAVILKIQLAYSDARSRV